MLKELYTKSFHRWRTAHTEGAVTTLSTVGVMTRLVLYREIVVFYETLMRWIFVYSSFNELCRKQSVWCPERRHGRLPLCYLAKQSTHNCRIMACNLFITEYINALSQSNEPVWLKCGLTLGDIFSLLERSWSQWEVVSKEESGFYFESGQAVIPINLSLIVFWLRQNRIEMLEEIFCALSFQINCWIEFIIQGFCYSFILFLCWRVFGRSPTTLQLFKNMASFTVYLGSRDSP